MVVMQVDFVAFFDFFVRAGSLCAIVLPFSVFGIWRLVIGGSSFWTC